LWLTLVVWLVGDYNQRTYQISKNLINITNDE